MNPARAWLFLLLFAACGAPARPDVDAAFRQIQVHEATIAHRQSAIETCGETRPCAAADEACAAADEICRIADEIDDPDAHARCGLARRRCPREDAQ